MLFFLLMARGWAGTLMPPSKVATNVDVRGQPRQEALASASDSSRGQDGKEGVATGPR